MIEARIVPGDRLIVDRGITPANQRLRLKGGRVGPRHSLTTFLFTLASRFTPPLQP